MITEFTVIKIAESGYRYVISRKFVELIVRFHNYEFVRNFP
jgi:hypothetical protein